MRHSVLLLLAIILSGCTSGLTTVEPIDLVKNGDFWNEKLVRTCGYVTTDAKTCSLRVCPPGTELKDVPSCKPISEIHLSSRAAACQYNSASPHSDGFWADADGHFLALRPNDTLTDANRFALTRSLVQRLPDGCRISANDT